MNQPGMREHASAGENGDPAGWTERYASDRPDLRPWMRALPAPYVEIGCGTGAMLARLREAGRVVGRCIGVEPDARRALRAREVFDEVHVSDVGACFDRLPEIGTLVLADVLEHMADPWGELARLRKRMRPDAVAYASLPNVAYAGVSWPLFWRGRFPYADTGILDRTHLRFFDRVSMRELFEDAGFRIVRMEGVMGRRKRLLNRLTLGRWEHLLCGQFLIEAAPRQ